MNEYPKMLYHATEGECIVNDFDAEQALGDEWMSLADLRAAQDAPPKRGPGRPRRQPVDEETDATEDDA